MRPGALLLVCLSSLALACGSSGDAPGSACKNPIGVSEAPAADVQHFASQRVGAEVGFQVPPNTASITIVEQAVSAPDTITYKPSGQAAQSLDNTAVPFWVRDPSGTRIYDDNPSTPVSSLSPDAIANLTAFFATNAPAVGTLTIPNSTGGLQLVGSTGLTAGRWQLKVSDYAYECTYPQKDATCTGGSAASLYDVTIITKPLSAGGGIPASGSLDVRIYFASLAAYPDVSAASAGTDPDLIRMEQTLRSLVANAGVTIGTMTYEDLPADVQTSYSGGVDIDQTGGCSDIANLFRHGRSGNTLNIFFVSSLFTKSQDLGDSYVVGLDGTIPGPATVGGTAGSGVAVAMLDLRSHSGNTNYCGSTPNFMDCGADETAYIIAHEAGHFLGLYHVTESDGTQFDPLLGTPMCPCSTCASTPSQCSTSYMMSVADCTQGLQNADGTLTCGGGDNLMFWRLEHGSAGVLLPEQQQVIRANPLVR